MKVLSLEASQYRNLLPGVFSPVAAVNVLCGQNAQGKTNVLEALWLFTGGKSFRGAKDAELLAYGEKEAVLSLRFYSEEREQTAVLRFTGGKRQAELNGVPLRSPGLLVGHLGAVIFSPEHISLVREGPGMRRNFIDAALCQLLPGYVRLLNRYQRILSQRNALLKDIPRHRELLDTLSIWDERLARDGEEITKKRERYVEQLSAPLMETYSGLSRGREALTVQYRRGAEHLREALAQSRSQDLQAGFTTCGPHREDLDLFLDGKSVRLYASQGQKRSVVLSMKLGEAQILEKTLGEKPLILLDDVLSELDSTRQEYLLNHLTDCQVLITCCEPGQTKNLLDGALFQVKEGVVERVDRESCISI